MMGETIRIHPVGKLLMDTVVYISVQKRGRKTIAKHALIKCKIHSVCYVYVFLLYLEI